MTQGGKGRPMYFATKVAPVSLPTYLAATETNALRDRFQPQLPYVRKQSLEELVGGCCLLVRKYSIDQSSGEVAG
jgi:hypothetical protein